MMRHTTLGWLLWSAAFAAAAPAGAGEHVYFGDLHLHTRYSNDAWSIPLPEGVPATLRERAFTSPIWYLPP